MQQSGVVSHLNGKIATVRGERASTCGTCAGKSSCATLGAWNSRALEIEVLNDLGAKVGDEVLIEVSDHLVLKSAFSLYGLPMLLFFGAGIAAWLLSSRTGSGNPDLLAALAGIVTVIVYYLSTVLRKEERAGLEARIVRIQTQPLSEEEVACRKRG